MEHDLLRTNLQFLKASNFVSLEKTIAGRLLDSCSALDETESLIWKEYLVTRDESKTKRDMSNVY
jgi:hypothetical protein